MFRVAEVSVRGAWVTVLLRCITARSFRGWWDCSWGIRTRSGRRG